MEQMRKALELAEKGRGFVSPNPLVGALILKEGRIIGQGYHKKAGGPHAEIEALQSLKESSQGATMVVTLEPCCHYGRTGPCTEAILKAGIKEVIVGALDPNPLVAGKGIECLRQGGIKVTCGVLANECQDMNKVFNKYISQQKPYVLLKTAMTLDGMTATTTGHSQWVTGEAARAYVHDLRHEYKAIMVGIGTILADDPALTCRRPQGGLDPWRIIVDRSAKLPLTSQVVKSAGDIPTFLACSMDAGEAELKDLTEQGVYILQWPEKGRVPLDWLMEELAKKEVDSILLEGGANLAGQMVRQNLVDEFLFFLGPKLVAGDGRGLFSGPGVLKMSEALDLSILEVKMFQEDLMIRAKVREAKSCSQD